MLGSRLALSLTLMTCAMGGLLATPAVAVVVEPVAPPVNDKPSDAVAIGASQLTVQDSLKFATGDAGTPLHGKSDLRTVWYKITNADPGAYVLALNGMTDASVGVWLDPLNPDSPGEWIKLAEDSAIPVQNKDETITAVSFTTPLKGKTFYIQVGNPEKSADSRFTLDIFRLGTKPVNPIVVFPQNRTVYGFGKYNSVFEFAGDKRYILNFTESDVTVNKSTTIPSGVDFGTLSTHLPGTTAMLATLKDTGGGPRFGEVGQWNEKLTFTAKSGSKTLGSVDLPVKVIRIGDTISGPSPIVEIKPNGGTAKMGDTRKLTLTITNRSKETMNGCAPMILSGNIQKNSADLLSMFAPYKFTYKQINMSTGKQIGDPNRIFNIKPDTTVQLDITFKLLEPVSMDMLIPQLICAEGPKNFDLKLGESTALIRTSVNGPSNAKVIFPDLKAPRTVPIAKNASKTVLVSVTNYGKKRSLTIFGSNQIFGQQKPTAISFKICADKAGSCAKDPVTSLKTSFEAGETRKFRVMVKRNGDAVSNDLGVERGHVMVYEDDKFVTTAGFGVKPK